MLKVTDLKKSYGTVGVLNGVSLAIEPGEINGLVGENGAGKTTLFKCIAGLETFDGSVSGAYDLLKNKTGYLPTNPFFFSKMTGYEYLRLLCQARKISGDDIQRFNLFDLPLKRYAETYSTGMQKKLAFTGILLQKNDIFLLDEPFNGVDVSSNLMICDILLQLKRLNKTILLSSHIFSSLQDTCDILHHLKEGKIVATVRKSDFYTLEAAMRSRQRVAGVIGEMFSR